MANFLSDGVATPLDSHADESQTAISSRASVLIKPATSNIERSAVHATVAENHRVLERATVSAISNLALS